MARRVQHRVRPDQTWFRSFEPYDTLVSAAYYFNSVSWKAPPGSVTLAEPWTEDGSSAPIDRTLFAFVKHPGLRARAAMRVGEHFVTRVAFIESPPPPVVNIGDPIWDEHVVTRAASEQEGINAFPQPLRALLQTWGFEGHIEMRAGGVVVYKKGVQPTPAGCDHLSDCTSQIVRATLNL